MASGTNLARNVIDSAVMLITCKHCGVEKDSSHFYLHKNGSWLRECKSCKALRGRKWRAENLEKSRAQGRKNAAASRARHLEKIRARFRARYAANPEKYREIRKQFYWADPEKARQAVKNAYWRNPERWRAAARQWSRDNRERATEKDRRWRTNNPERMKVLKHRHYLNRKDYIRAKNNAWEKANPEKARLIRQGIKGRRRARIKANGFEKFSLKEILRRDGYQCHICGGKVKPKELSFDHLIPISKGGSHTRKNVAVPHLSCNLERGVGRLPAQLRLLD